MGLTWIDHDTIDRPVEELAAGTVEAEDIEFTIETLGGSHANVDKVNPVESHVKEKPGRRESLHSKKVAEYI